MNVQCFIFYFFWRFDTLLSYLLSLLILYQRIFSKLFWDKSHQKEFKPDPQKILKMLQTYSLKTHDGKNVQEVKCAPSFTWSISETYSLKNKCAWAFLFFLAACITDIIFYVIISSLYHCCWNSMKQHTDKRQK